jgi:hypothetical protein
VSLRNGSSWPSRPTGARSKRRLGWRPVRKDNIGAQQLRYATSMNRGTLYFRLSLIWLAIVVAGVVYVLLQ